MVDLRTGEEAINRGLAKRLQQLADERERRERAALAADAEFTAEFLSAARAVFNMIDVDESGDLEKEEIVLPGVLLIIRGARPALLSPRLDRDLHAIDATPRPTHSLIDLRTGDRCQVEPKGDQVPDQLRQ